MTRIDLKDIRLWNRSQHEGFEELCCQLASLETVPANSTFWRKAGAGGDAGVECYWILPNGDELAWQVKYFFELGDSQWSKIDESVQNALDKHPRLVAYTVCLPINLADARKVVKRKRQLSQKDHWENHLKKWQQWATKRGMNVKFIYWGEFQIVTERLYSSNQKYVGRAYFWFNQQELTIEWMYRHFKEVEENAGVRYTPEIHVDLPEAQLFEGLGRTDAFFDRIDDL